MPISVVTQLAYDGKPLYLFQTDEQIGDTLGNGVSGIWHVVHIQ